MISRIIFYNINIMLPKRTLLLVGLAVVVLGAGYFIFSSRQKNYQIPITSGGANWTFEQNKKLQEGIVNLTGKYLEAALATNTVFSTDIENTSYGEWKTRLDRSMVLWRELEQKNQQMEQSRLN